jgi:hypothetical protein
LIARTKGLPSSRLATRCSRISSSVQALASVMTRAPSASSFGRSRSMRSALAVAGVARHHDLATGLGLLHEEISAHNEVPLRTMHSHRFVAVISLRHRVAPAS